MPDLKLTMAQQFEIAKTLRECEKADKEQLLAVVESCLRQMSMYKNTINQLITEWPYEQS